MSFIKKYTFKDSNRVFWNITYEMYENMHYFILECEEWKNSKIVFSKNRWSSAEGCYDDGEYSVREIMMEIAQRFSDLGLKFASGILDVHPKV